jgi:hypothetical protein
LAKQSPLIATSREPAEFHRSRRLLSIQLHSGPAAPAADFESSSVVERRAHGQQFLSASKLPDCFVIALIGSSLKKDDAAPMRE